MEMTNKIISEFIAYYNLDDELYIPHLLADPVRVQEIVSQNFHEADPVGKLAYEDLHLLSKEHYKYLERNKGELHNLYDVEVHLTDLLIDIAFNEVLEAFSASDVLVSLLKDELKVAA